MRDKRGAYRRIAKTLCAPALSTSKARIELSCQAMKELKSAEDLARSLHKGNIYFSVTVLFAQWALDAQRAQRIHAENCEACKEAS
jgi:hypothetical protein